MQLICWTVWIQVALWNWPLSSYGYDHRNMYRWIRSQYLQHVYQDTTRLYHVMLNSPTLTNIYQKSRCAPQTHTDCSDDAPKNKTHAAVIVRYPHIPACWLCRLGGLCRFPGPKKRLYYPNNMNARWVYSLSTMVTVNLKELLSTIMASVTSSVSLETERLTPFRRLLMFPTKVGQYLAIWYYKITCHRA